MNLGRSLFPLKNSIYRFTDNLGIDVYDMYDMCGNAVWFSIKDSFASHLLIQFRIVSLSEEKIHPLIIDEDEEIWVR